METKRLKYEKINNSDDVLSIDLFNGYSVIAITGYNDEIESYITSLFLKENSIDTFRLIGGADKLIVPKCERINSAILKTVSDFLANGFLQYYIDQYEFEENLLNEAIMQLEKQRWVKQQELF